ncbi:MAG: hypothetical protein LWW98_07725 [Deltaproteobacteria bacterium]|nr:hypothetical protein [Deltaproteobacteria bacterium]
MVKRVWIVCFLSIVLTALITPKAYSSEPVAFTLEDRDRIIRMEVVLTEFKKQVDQRFEQVDKRFEQMMNFLLMLGGIFTSLTLGVIGFAYWDRRTVIREATDGAIKKIECEGRLRDLILALRELSSTNLDVAKVMRNFHLL